MNDLVIAYDLGTGGIKSSAISVEGKVVNSAFVAYDTYYEAGGIQEQAPEDWWRALVESTHRLLQSEGVEAGAVRAVAISGHSLGVVPIGVDGSLLRQRTPIWSDTRAREEAEAFFCKVDYRAWYEETGNGFPAACYPLFKIAWYRQHEPEMYSLIDKVIGTKDYCNYRLTGRLCTDYSYASGSGAFSLHSWKYREDYMEAAGVPSRFFPELIPSDGIVGDITPQAAAGTGLPVGTKVICGGVDNSCMALGAKGIADGRVYTSLGSSAWIALVSGSPVLDFQCKPYVFAHVLPGMYASALSIFSAGTSFQWVRKMLCADLLEKEERGLLDSYQEIDRLVSSSAPGANGVLFNPSMAGGSMMEPTPDMSGAFANLKLEHTRGDLLRAVREGIAMNLRIALDLLRRCNGDMESMLIVGGGAKSPTWMQIFADIYDLPVEKTNIDQEAASLGAAALALNGTGLWQGYDRIDLLHRTEHTYQPREENRDVYAEAQRRFEALRDNIADMNIKAQEI